MNEFTDSRQVPLNSSIEPRSAEDQTTADSNFDTYLDPANYDRESGPFELEG